MISLIRAGESVVFQGQVIDNIEDLPSEADLAIYLGDSDAVAKAEASLKAEVERLQRELSKLPANTEAVAADTTVEPSAFEAGNRKASKKD